MKHSISLLLFFLPALLCAQAVDSTVIRQVDSLIQVSRTLTGEQNFDKALEVNADAEKIALEHFGRESAAYGNCCFNRGRVLFFQGEYPEAEKWYLEAKMIREKALGALHSDYVACVTNLAILYEATGNTEQAEAHYTEAVTLHENIGGKQQETYVRSLSQLANLYYKLRQLDKALPLMLEAASIWEQHLDKSSQTYFWILNNLGNIYDDLGQFKEARQIHIDLKDRRKQVLGEDHPDFVASLRNLAAVDQNLGYFEEAEQLYLQAKDIHARTAGKDLDYASILSSLGLLYDHTGKFDTAEQQYLEARSIIVSTLGKNHEKYYGLLINMGLLYHSVNPRKAESLYLEARDYFERLGKEHYGYMYCQNNLGVLYADLGEWEKSEACHLEILDLRSKLLGQSHPYYAYSLGNLGNLYTEKGQFDKAEAMYLEAQTIFLNALGSENLDYINSLYALGNLYNTQNELRKAESYYTQFMQLSERIQGKDNKAYADILIHIGDVYEMQKRHEAADSSFLKASPIRFSDLLKAASIYSEVELATHTQSFEKENAKLLDLLAARVFKQSDVGALPGVVFDNVLFYKGFLLSAATRINQVNTSDPTIAQVNTLLKASRRQLAVEYTKPRAERDSLYIVELEDKAAQAEKQLAKQVIGYAGALQQVAWQKVLATLKSEEAAVEFIHFRLQDKKSADSTMYAALLLLPGTVQQPVFIPLFEEKNLDSLIHTSRERRADYVNHLYSLAKRGATTLGKPKKTLYELLWEPLAKHLAGVNTIYYSPSGLLHRLNLGAIPINPDSVLADRYHLVELGSTRQLVIPNAHKPAANDALLFGGIQYEVDSTAMFQANAGLDSVSIASRGELSFAYTDSTLRTGAWGPLPFTDREVSSVEKTLKSAGFQSETRRGFAATEEAFKTIGAGVKPSPRVLHLATHGFFFPDPAPHGGAGGAPEPVFKLSDHPMIRSGLILAGGNHAWVTGKPIKPGMEDGILTAYEISQMNLSNTELVVLSACETGLGDIQGNEGVYGLQRAFKIAGAKYLIMSLWQVDDRATMQFMEVFYRKWLQDKLPIPEAFRATQADLRERLLGQPYLWAGFVLVE